MDVSQQLPVDVRGRNAWSHGMRARKVIVKAEEQGEFETLRAALIEDWRPRNVTQWLLVDHLARLQWRLLRAGEAEADRLAKLQGERTDTELPEAALAWDLCRAQSGLQRIQLFQMRLERAVARSIGLLIALRKSRGKRGNSRRTAGRQNSPQTGAGPGDARRCAAENGTNETQPAAGTYADRGCRSRSGG